jgi:hypothetical protein
MRLSSRMTATATPLRTSGAGAVCAAAERCRRYFRSSSDALAAIAGFRFFGVMRSHEPQRTRSMVLNSVIVGFAVPPLMSMSFMSMNLAGGSALAAALGGAAEADEAAMSDAVTTARATPSRLWRRWS